MSGRDIAVGVVEQEAAALLWAYGADTFRACAELPERLRRSADGYELAGRLDVAADLRRAAERLEAIAEVSA